jgi:hypothetical protein
MLTVLRQKRGGASDEQARVVAQWRAVARVVGAVRRLAHVGRDAEPKQARRTSRTARWLTRSLADALHESQIDAGIGDCC